MRLEWTLCVVVQYICLYKIIRPIFVVTFQSIDRSVYRCEPPREIATYKTYDGDV